MTSGKPDGYVRIDTEVDHKGLEAGLEKMKSTATKAIATLTAAISTASVAAIQLGSDFEQANAKASTLFGEAEVNMTQYSQNMLALSNKTGLAAADLGNTMYDALSAGIPASDDMSESLAFLEKNAKLAKAGFTDINTATTATAKVLNAYKMDVSEADKVHKILIQTQNKGITTVNELGSVLAQVTPTASAMNVSFEQVGAALSNMTAQGTPTAQATTQLNQLIAELGKTGTTGAKGLALAAEGTEYAGKSFTELMDEGVALNTILDLMSDYAKENNISMIDMFSSIEAGKAALALSGQNSQQFTNNLIAMHTEVDVVGEAYEKVTNTFQEKSKKVVNSLKNVGIQAYQKFEKPMKEAMDNAQESINTLSKEMSSGKLGKSTEKIAEKFGSLISVTAKLATKTIPILIDAFAAIVDNGEKIVPVLAGIGTGMLAFKTYTGFIQPMQKAWEAATVALSAHEAAQRLTLVASAGTTGGITAQQIAVGLLTGKIEAATAAQWLMNTATSALSNPITLAVGAAAALGAGLTALVVHYNETTGAHREEVKAIIEERESFEELRKSQEEQLTANLAEIDNVQQLKMELGLLVDENGNLIEGYENRANFILGELNNALGTEYTLTDLQIGKYEELSKSIDDLMQKKRAQIILNGQEAEYTEAVNNVRDAEIKLIDLENKLNETKTANDEKIIGLKAQLANATGYEAMSIQDKINALEQETREAQAAYDNQKLTVEGYYDAISTYETNYALFSQGTADALAAIEASTVAVKAETVSEKKKQLEDEIKATQGYIDYLKGEYETATNESAKNVIQQAIDTKEKVVESKQQEIDGLTSVVKNKGQLYDQEVKRLASQALESFDGDTEEYFGVSKEKFDNVIKGLQSKDPEVKKQAEKEASEMIKSLRSKNDKFKDAGADMIEGAMNGSNSKIGNFYSQMGIYGNNLLAKFKNSLGISSPSKEFAKLSKWIPEGIAAGVESTEKKALNAVHNLSENMTDAFEVKSPDDFNISGVINQIRQGISAEQLQFEAVAKISAAKEKMRIQELEMGIAKAFVNGKLEAHLYIEGREAAISLAPFISEELAFGN